MIEYALTLWRPWPWAILWLPSEDAKPVENRTWAPPDRLIGKRLAIHASKRLDSNAELQLRADYDGVRLPSFAYETGIVGTVRVAGVVRAADPHGLPGLVAGEYGAASPLMVDAWFTGPVGWVFDEVKCLPTSIPCRGLQRLWRVPQDVALRLAEAGHE